MGYEEVSKAYRVYDIEAGRVVISRDVTFDEMIIGFSPLRSSDDDEDATLDFSGLDISNDNGGPVQYQQTGKRKDRSSDANSKDAYLRPAHHGANLEEASVPDRAFRRQVKNRPDMHARSDLSEEEEKGNHDDEDSDSTPPMFWRASANAVEVSDLSEPEPL